MIVAVDGPAGVGKSSVCSKIAKDLKWIYINSGVFYRACAFLTQTENLDFSSHATESMNKLSCLWKTFEFEFTPAGFLSPKLDVSTTLFTPQIAKIASHIATFSFIREFVNQKIQACLSSLHSYIVEGRDAASKIVPHAALKLYLDASLEVRTNRRATELVAKNLQTEVSQLFQEIQNRDFQDKTRSVDPLQSTPESIIIDTTFLEFAQVVEVVKNLIFAASE